MAAAFHLLYLLPAALVGSQGRRVRILAPADKPANGSAQATAHSARFGPWDDLFKMGRSLDKGSQGEIFMCTRMKNGAHYAVKRIDLGTLEMRNKNAKMRTNLKREIEIMRGLTHPRIVNLLEAYWNNELCFIVMDLAQGGCLHDKLITDIGLRGGEDASKYVARQLLEGMAYMHEHQVVHRDLKPQNVLITQCWKGGNDCEFHEIKIADFGLSRCLNEVGGAKAAMTAVGTPAFAAPEVMTGKYDETSDYWSFGCVTYMMVCGNYPFEDCPCLQPKKYRDGAAAEVYDCASWRKASEDVKAFINGLLTVSSRFRFGLSDCLRHRWLREVKSTHTDRPRPDVARRSGRKHVKDANGNFPAGIPEAPSPRTNALGVANRAKCFGGAAVLLRRLAHAMQGSGPLHAVTPAMDIRGVFSGISGWSGTQVDSVYISLRGSERHHAWRSGTGGVKQRKWSLREDEVIIAVRQELSGGLLGAALVFYTSRCQIIAHEGTDAVKRRRFVAPVGWQVIGLQFEAYRLSGILMERVPSSGLGSVESISGNVGYAVDWVAFTMRDGTSTRYGEDGGSMPEDFALAEHEYIVIVEQGPRDGYLGNSLVFFLSSGRVIQFKGMAAARSLRFMTRPGKQICDLDFKDVGDGQLQLSSVSTCPLNGNVAAAEVHVVDDSELHAVSRRWSPGSSSEQPSRTSLFESQGAHEFGLDF